LAGSCDSQTACGHDGEGSERVETSTHFDASVAGWPWLSRVVQLVQLVQLAARSWRRPLETFGRYEAADRSGLERSIDAAVR
jgi:hypothetical protein